MGDGVAESPLVIDLILILGAGPGSFPFNFWSLSGLWRMVLNVIFSGSSSLTAIVMLEYRATSWHGSGDDSLLYSGSLLSFLSLPGFLSFLALGASESENPPGSFTGLRPRFLDGFGFSV